MIYLQNGAKHIKLGADNSKTSGPKHDDRALAGHATCHMNEPPEQLPLRCCAFTAALAQESQTEKLTLPDGSHRAGPALGARAVTAANTAAKPLDNACPVRTSLECRPSTRTATDGPGRCAYSYGSDDQATGPGARRSPVSRCWLNNYEDGTGAGKSRV